MNDFETIRLPYLHIVFSAAGRFAAESRSVAEELQEHAARLVHGARMRTKQALFHELAAALNFPGYFGKNWDALDECLSDLEWLPAAGYIISIAEANELLADHLKQIKILLDVLNAAGSFWAEEKPPKPFHVVFGCPPECKGAMEERFGSVPYDLRMID